MSAQYIVRPPTAFRDTSSRMKNPRKQERDHLAFVRTLPCAVCGSYVRVHAAHLRSPSLLYAKGAAGLQAKPDDAWTTPLCAAHHTEGDDAQHKGNELEFWARFGIDPFGLCLALYRASGNEEQALLILSEFRTPLHGTALVVCRKKDGLHYVWEEDQFRRSFTLATAPVPAVQPTDRERATKIVYPHYDNLMRHVDDEHLIDAIASALSAERRAGTEAAAKIADEQADGWERLRAAARNDGDSQGALVHLSEAMASRSIAIAIRSSLKEGASG